VSVVAKPALTILTERRYKERPFFQRRPVPFPDGAVAQRLGIIRSGITGDKIGVSDGEMRLSRLFASLLRQQQISTVISSFRATLILASAMVGKAINQ
jgi:hypothetical protein